MGRINKAIFPFVGLKPLHHLRIDNMVLIVGLGPRSQLWCRDHGPSCGVGTTVPVVVLGPFVMRHNESK
mgnify:CR=1 FL=1